MRSEPKEAEIAVIGSCMIEAQALRDVSGVLGGEHFTDQRCRSIYEKMLDLMRQGKPWDIISVGTSLDEARLAYVGGMPGLMEIVNLVPSALNVQHYAETLVQAYGLRKIIEAAASLGKEPSNEAFQNSMRQALVGFNVGKMGAVTRMAENAAAYPELMDKRIAGGDIGIQTPFPSMNRMTAGFHKGTLWTFGARTSRGKSSVLLKAAHQGAKTGAKILFISAEMTSLELVDRILAMTTGIPLMTLRTRAVAQVKSRVVSALGEIYRLPITTACGGKLTMDRVITEVDTHQPDMVIIDYIQRFSPPADAGSRAAFFSDVANGLKALAMDKKICVVTASQLSRGIELRDDHTPTLADLKESGGIEEAADLIVFINVPHDSEMDGIRRGEFIVAKHRNGPLGRFPVIFKEQTTDFCETEEIE